MNTVVLESGSLGGRASLPRLRREDLLAGGVALLLFAEWVAVGANLALLAALAALAQLALAAALLFLLRREGFAHLLNRGRAPALLFLGAVAWAAAPLALSGVRGDGGRFFEAQTVWLELVKLCGVAACFVIGAALGRSRQRALTLITALVAAGALQLVLGLALRQIDPVSVWGLSKTAHRWRFTATFLNANAAACLATMTALLAIGILQAAALRLRDRWHAPDAAFAAFAAGAALLAAAGCVLTGSRLGLLLLFGLGLWLLATAPGAARSVYRTLSAQGGRIAMLAAVPALALVAVGAPALRRVNFSAGDLGDRAGAYLDYLRHSGQAPLFGYGLGSFGEAHSAWLTVASADRWNMRAAHNAPLQAALEGGWPFLALLLGALAVVAAQVWRRRGRLTSFRLRAAICAAAIPAVCSLLDISLNVPALAATAAVLWGLVWGRAVSEPPRVARQPRPLPPARPEPR